VNGGAEAFDGVALLSGVHLLGGYTRGLAVATCMVVLKRWH
jgi:hypothetical protein